VISNANDLLNIWWQQQPDIMLLQFWFPWQPGTLHFLRWTGPLTSQQWWWWHELNPSK
jgi:hypothetical protein